MVKCRESGSIPGIDYVIKTVKGTQLDCDIDGKSSSQEIIVDNHRPNTFDVEFCGDSSNDAVEFNHRGKWDTAWQETFTLPARLNSGPKQTSASAKVRPNVDKGCEETIRCDIQFCYNPPLVSPKPVSELGQIDVNVR